jgi:hypothetical protein
VALEYLTKLIAAATVSLMINVCSGPILMNGTLEAEDTNLELITSSVSVKFALLTKCQYNDPDTLISPFATTSSCQKNQA